MIHDVIIVGAGAAGLFAGINLDKKLNKLILEKTDKPGVKVLLSGGERANISNMDIEPERDYFSQNKKFLLSVFSRYNQWDIMSFFSGLGIEIVEEDRGRLILKSGDSRELLDALLKQTKKNNCEIKLNSDVKIIEKKDDFFEIETKENKKYITKNIIVSSGGKSFFHVGTTGEGYSIAEKLGINVVTPYRTLCGLSTKMNLSEISGVSSDVKLVLKDKNNKKTIYEENGPILFTHFGVSGPIIHNASNAIGEYLNSITPSVFQTSPPCQGENINESFEKYILDNLSIDITFDINKTPKRLIKFFELTNKVPPHGGGCPLGQGETINLQLQNWRSWKEAKATGGGIDTGELDNNMQSKKYPGLYFIGEVVDVTGKTGGYNLQWAWSSAYVCSEGIENI